LLTKKIYHSKLQKIEHVARDTFVLSLENADLSHNISAGQFVEIKVPNCAEILWRRPFSIHDAQPEKNLVYVLFNAVGRGTAVLTDLLQDTELEILGPLGNHFTYEDNLTEALVVAGGLGIAPFMLMKRELERRQIPMRLFYGVGTAEQFCGLERFQTYADIHLSTVDGSRGHHGMVSDVLVNYLRENTNTHSKAMFVCGPTAMLRTVQHIAQKHEIPAQVSVETIMACGFGACVGCAVPMAHPIAGEKEYYLACKDGPVFNMNEIVIDD
jgi:dihydroorotate dehydrogenase electron transfer subunit